jgi:hypothetical protein
VWLWQDRVREEDVHQSAFQTPDGLMDEWVAMPFVLCKAPITIQRMMNDILHDVLHFKLVTQHMNDICVYNRTLKEYLERLRLVLQRCDEGLKLRLKKCFGLQDMEYLGYTMPGGKISLSTKKVEVVKYCPVLIT